MIIFKCKTPLDIKVGTEVETFFSNKKGIVVDTSDLMYDIDRNVGHGFFVKFEGREHLSEIAFKDITKLRENEIFCLETIPEEFSHDYIMRWDVKNNKLMVYYEENGEYYRLPLEKDEKFCHGYMMQEKYNDLLKQSKIVFEKDKDLFG